MTPAGDLTGPGQLCRRSAGRPANARAQRALRSWPGVVPPRECCGRSLIKEVVVDASAIAILWMALS
jgi:hypothetical protein